MSASALKGRAFFSLGSNIGNRGEHLREGVRIVARADAHRVSRVYETEPVGGVAQDDFWNLVLEVVTDDPPRDLLDRAREAEEARQRQRVVRWGPRTLDVDVLFAGEQRSSDPEILVPHPRIFERAFVLAPLRELAPDLVSDDALARADGAVRVLGTLASLR